VGAALLVLGGAFGVVDLFAEGAALRVADEVAE
jgi:hypothetical protein